MDTKALFVASWLVLSAIAPPALAKDAGQRAETKLSLESGVVEGRVLPSGQQAYLGIPYAQPPVRDLRWRAPRSVVKWTGVLHADRYGPQCIQPLRGILSNSYSGAEQTSEDCLYLNVWTKASHKKAPVVVYIHGGAFFIGSSSMPMYGGEAVSQEGAIFVNFNYRLGALGLLAHPELSKESPHRTSGNFALLDQIAALEWVKANIAQFGGDPNNVTIVGQSAGSMSVGILQASPLAEGLFHRAVAMSGSVLDGPVDMMTLAAAEAEGVKFQTMLGAKSLAELRAMPADRLAVPRSPSAPKIGPIVDGHVLPRPVEQIFAEGKQADVPLVLGFTSDESFGGLGPVRTLAEYRAKVQGRYGPRSGDFLALYPAASDEAAQAQARLSDRDSTMAIGMDAWAMAQARHGRAKVYAYEFVRKPPFTPGATIEGIDPATAGAYHTSEVPFWLGTLDTFNTYRKTRDWTPADRDFARGMTGALVRFARTGTPEIGGVAWAPFDPSARNAIVFGTTVTQGTWPDKRKLDFFRTRAASSSQRGAVRE